MNEINEIFDRLFAFFEVSTITELSKKLEMSQPAVTNWQRRNSISAIKKKCRELGIYNEIFGEINSSVLINQGNNSRASARDYNEDKKEDSNSSSLIPNSILIELNSLFERFKYKDEDFIKNITYEIEDYINEIKRKTRS